MPSTPEYRLPLSCSTHPEPFPVSGYTDTMPHDMDESLEADWRKEPLRVQLESLHSSPHRIEDHVEYRRNEHPSNV